MYEEILKIFNVRLPNIIFSLKEYIWRNSELVNESSFSLRRANLGIQVMYSKKNNNYLINFNNLGLNQITTTCDDQLPLISIQGTSSNIQISNLTINLGGKKIIIDRVLYLNEEDFLYFISKPSQFINTFLFAVNSNIPPESKNDKRKALERFQFLLDTEPSEHSIEKYIEHNPFILEYGLHLSDLHYQVVLETFEEDFEQNLIPDVIGWYNKEKRWAIVDYKKYDKKLVKKSWRVRSGLMAEVKDLEYQLNDYLDYFYRSKSQTQLVKDKYGINIVYPVGFGIIGKVASEDSEPFLKATYDLKKNIQIIPYNYLVDECKRVIDLA